MGGQERSLEGEERSRGESRRERRAEDSGREWKRAEESGGKQRKEGRLKKRMISRWVGRNH